MEGIRRPLGKIFEAVREGVEYSFEVVCGNNMVPFF